MNNQILRCCPNTSKYLVSYKIGSKFYVCKNCIHLEHWFRGIESKKEIDNHQTIDLISLSQQKEI